MAYTYNELRHMKVDQLREIATELDDASLEGHTALPKTRLLPLLCAALGVEMHAHHEVVGIDKAAVKARIKELKSMRNATLETHDRDRLKRVRRDLHKQRRKLRKATV
jgi:hypothetical protein